MGKRINFFIKGLVLGISFLAISGCATAPGVQYGDATALQTLSTDFSSSDLQQIAESMVDSLLTFPPIV